MADRFVDLVFDGSQQIDFKEVPIDDCQPYGRPATSLSSHALITALLYNCLLRDATISSPYSIAELTYAALHHDDGKTSQKWQTWFIKSAYENKKDWLNYEDHIKPRYFDPKLHNKQLQWLLDQGIEVAKPTDKVVELVKWAMRNHHPHKAKDAISCRLERMYLVLADHTAAKIETIQSIEGNHSINLYDDVLHDGKYIYGMYFSFYYPEIETACRHTTIEVQLHTENQSTISEGHVF